MEDEDTTLTFVGRRALHHPDTLEMITIPDGQDEEQIIVLGKWMLTTTTTPCPQVQWVTLWEDRLEPLYGTEYKSTYLQ